MYAGDRNPPHFHVIANDGAQAWVGLISLQVIHGTVRPAVLREALTWAGSHAANLAIKWKELNP